MQRCIRTCSYTAAGTARAVARRTAEHGVLHAHAGRLRERGLASHTVRPASLHRVFGCHSAALQPYSPCLGHQSWPNPSSSSSHAAHHTRAACDDDDVSASALPPRTLYCRKSSSKLSRRYCATGLSPAGGVSKEELRAACTPHVVPVPRPILVQLALFGRQSEAHGSRKCADRAATTVPMTVRMSREQCNCSKAGRPVTSVPAAWHAGTVRAARTPDVGRTVAAHNDPWRDPPVNTGQVLQVQERHHQHASCTAAQARQRVAAIHHYGTPRAICSQNRLARQCQIAEGWAWRASQLAPAAAACACACTHARTWRMNSYCSEPGCTSCSVLYCRKCTGPWSKEYHSLSRPAGGGRGGGAVDGWAGGVVVVWGRDHSGHSSGVIVHAYKTPPAAVTQGQVQLH